ncbi:MAG: hypothetical protein HRT69_06550 [Flavobacteriaceae bacterium]|nr:hypothetical protein [Flavobacteriaceae bacterium]
MKKLLFTLAIGLATLTSCESDLVSAPPSDSVGGAAYDGVLLKKDIISNADGTVNNTSEYTYDGNKIIKIVNVSEFGTETTIYAYTDNLLTRIDDEHVNPSGAISSEVNLIEYDSNDRVIKETVTYEVGAPSVDTYLYNADGTVTYTEGVGSGNEGVSVFTLLSGNLVSTVSTAPWGDYNYTYTYDEKNNPFRNIHQARVFALIGNLSTPNNVLTKTQTSGSDMGGNDEVNTHAYNPEGYPIASTEVYAPGTVYAETTTTEYFYE